LSTKIEQAINDIFLFQNESIKNAQHKVFGLFRLAGGER
jgi:hypothetical protein